MMSCTVTRSRSPAENLVHPSPRAARPPPITDWNAHHGSGHASISGITPAWMPTSCSMTSRSPSCCQRRANCRQYP